jgi:hypothetical protein
LGALSWGAGSALLSWYLGRFGNLPVLYGSLSAVVGLVLWIWVSAVAILVGAELDDPLRWVGAEASRRRSGGVADQVLCGLALRGSAAPVPRRPGSGSFGPLDQDVKPQLRFSSPVGCRNAYRVSWLAFFPNFSSAQNRSSPLRALMIREAALQLRHGARARPERATARALQIISGLR